MSASTQPHPDQAFCILAERFAAGSLAGSDREEFRRRLEQQPDLERYVTGILSRDAALREIIPIIAKRREQERAQGQGARRQPPGLDAPPPRPPRPAGRRALQLLAWAAPLAAAVVMAIILIERAASRPAAPGEPVAIVSGTTLRLGDHEARTVACPDGSLLGLEGGAELAFTEDGQGMRILLRAGAMSADIRPQPAGRPLRIAAPQADLVVIGTSFRVSTDHDRTELKVEHGSVRFTTRSHDGEFLVAAGEYATAGSGPDSAVKGLIHGVLPEGQATGQLVRAIACGQGTSVAYDGVRYEADRDFEGGRVVPWLQARLPANPLTASGRCGIFRYAIPLRAGRYAVTLRLHEPDLHPAPGRRVFTIDVQGERIWQRMDIDAAVGRGPLLDLTSVVEVSQGSLDIRCFADHPVLGDDASPVIAAILVRRITP
jgi:ferric-dicitrate binding protein FerR (iron transport regulator)